MHQVRVVKIYYLLFIIYYLLFIIYYLLFTIYYYHCHILPPKLYKMCDD